MCALHKRRELYRRSRKPSCGWYFFLMNMEMQSLAGSRMNVVTALVGVLKRVTQHSTHWEFSQPIQSVPAIVIAIAHALIGAPPRLTASMFHAPSSPRAALTAADKAFERVTVRGNTSGTTIQQFPACIVYPFFANGDLLLSWRQVEFIPNSAFPFKPKVVPYSSPALSGQASKLTLVAGVHFYKVVQDAENKRKLCFFSGTHANAGHSPSKVLSGASYTLPFTRLEVLFRDTRSAFTCMYALRSACGEGTIVHAVEEAVVPGDDAGGADDATASELADADVEARMESNAGREEVDENAHNAHEGTVQTRFASQYSDFACEPVEVGANGAAFQPRQSERNSDAHFVEERSATSSSSAIGSSFASSKTDGIGMRMPETSFMDQIDVFLRLHLHPVVIDYRCTCNGESARITTRPRAEHGTRIYRSSAAGSVVVGTTAVSAESSRASSPQKSLSVVATSSRKPGTHSGNRSPTKSYGNRSPSKNYGNRSPSKSYADRFRCKSQLLIPAPENADHAAHGTQSAASMPLSEHVPAGAVPRVETVVAVVDDDDVTKNVFSAVEHVPLREHSSDDGVPTASSDSFQPQSLLSLASDHFDPYA